MKRGLSCCLVGICCLASLAAAQQVDEPEAELVDRILAVVDEDPILDSDLAQAIGIGLMAPEEGESENDYRRRLLDVLIDQKLRFYEIDLFGFSEIPVAVTIGRQESGSCTWAWHRNSPPRGSPLSLSTTSVRNAWTQLTSEKSMATRPAGPVIDG